MTSLPNSFKTSNVSNPLDGFKTYLKLQSVSPITVRNYLADLNHFLGWLELKVRSRNLPLLDEPEFIRLYFTENFIAEYKKFLLSNSLPSSTINRRLSALRTFGKFCQVQAWIEKNPAKRVSNVSDQRSVISNQHREKILAEFRKHLEAERTSSNTIKSYISDIRSFLTWIEVLGT